MNDPIVQEGDPVLRRTADPVPEEDFGTPELAAVVDRMLEALDKEQDGVALAAPQIGIPLRIFVVRYDRMRAAQSTDDETSVAEQGVFINPEITRSSRRVVEVDEGCLSVRRIYGKTLRHERATVRARLPDGTRFERGGGGILAQAFQHEIDHLDGMLFIDHATDLVTIKPEELDQARAERRARRAARAAEQNDTDHAD